MKLLMHICCAPCANMPIDALRADGIDLTGYWYNPNIHPFTEYRARRNCLQEYAKAIGRRCSCATTMACGRLSAL